MLHPNVGLLVCRQSKESFAVLATRHISTHKIVAVYDRTSITPLWDYHDKSGGEDSLRAAHHRVPSFAPGFLKTFAAKLRLRQTGTHGLPEGLTPEDIFHYAYAVFYSPEYRRRYAEFLKIDFPRLPLTSSLDLFRALAALGGELVALHLLESPKLDKLITRFTGDPKQGIERVGYTVEAASRRLDESQVQNRGASCADQRRDGATTLGAVWIDKAQTTGFKGVPDNVWTFHIGGYQVCEKWLKDRKGRTLSPADLTHYQKVVVALHETIRLMSEIDKAIEEHGGWPGAFAADEGAARK